MKLRKAIRSAKLSSSISVVCLVILVGVTILSSVFTQATTHFAYAKKRSSDKSSTGSDSGSGSSSDSGGNSNPSSANSNPSPNPDNTGGTSGGSNSNPSNVNSNPSSNPDNTGGSQSQGITGSTNQQQCPSGQHFDSKKNKCVKDTIKPANTTSVNSTIPGISLGAKCLVGEHLDEFGRCSTAAESVRQPLFAPSLKGLSTQNGSTSASAESVHQPLFAPSLKVWQNGSASAESVQNPGNSSMGSAAKCLIGQHFENEGQKCVPDSTSAESVQKPGIYINSTLRGAAKCLIGQHFEGGEQKCVPDSTSALATTTTTGTGTATGGGYAGAAAKCLTGQHLDALGRCVNDISIGSGGITIGTHSVGAPPRTPSTLNTLSSSSTTGTTTGTTPSTTPPNADGSCPKGYHIVNDNPDANGISCVKDTPSTTTTGIGTTTGGGYAGAAAKCLIGQHPDLFGHCVSDTTGGPPTVGSGGGGGGAASLANTAATHTPSTLNTQSALSSTTGTTTGTTTGAPNCTGDTHLDNGKCVGNDVRLPSGGCVPGYHLGSKPDDIQPGRFVKLCVKDTPSTGTGTGTSTGTTPSTTTTTTGTTPSSTPSQPIPLGDGSFQLPTVEAGPVDIFTGERACPSGSHTVILSSPQFSCVVDNVQCPLGTSQVGDRCVPPSKSTPTQPGNTGGSTTSTTTPSTTGTTTKTTPSSTTTGTTTGTGSAPSTTAQLPKQSGTTGGTATGTSTNIPVSNNNPKTNTNSNPIINQNGVSSQALPATSPSSGNIAGPAYTQGQSMSMWSLSLGKSNFPKDGLRLLANLKPFATIGVPYTLDISFNLPSGNLSLIAAQITNDGPQHAVIVPINKTSEGTAGESLYQAELGQTLTGINPFTKQPDTIPVGGVTDLLLWNSSPTDIAFNDDSGATMTLAHR